jgi:hypothetical protein
MEHPPSPFETDSLHEFVEVEMRLKGLEDPVRARALLDLLQELKGVKEVAIDGDKVALAYEPVSITREELSERIRGAGFQIGSVETAAASPVADALAQAIHSTPHPPSADHRS